MHQLRYLLAYGGDADAALASSGHSYLVFVEPLMGLALAFAAGHLVHRLAQARRRAAPLDRRRLALVFAVALVAVFTGQEFLEAQLVPGRPGVFSDGGWIAVPLAVLIGALLSLASRAAAVAGPAALVRHRLRPALARLPLFDAEPGRRPDSSPSSPLALHLAGRAPPSSATS